MDAMDETGDELAWLDDDRHDDDVWLCYDCGADDPDDPDDPAQLRFCAACAHGYCHACFETHVCARASEE